MMSLRGDPHRRVAYDYGSDIGIDPQIRSGQRAVYLRINAYAGIWVRPSHQFHPELEKAEKRVMEGREYMEAYQNLKANRRRKWIEALENRTEIPVRIEKSGLNLTEEPVTPLSLFLSYSRRNVLMARNLFEKLGSEARANAWFDLAQPEEVQHDEAWITKWLESAIDQSRVFVVLSTRQSAASEWVCREIEWALKKADRGELHFVVLKLDETEVPEAVKDTKYTIDCDGLSEGEIFEELYSAVYARPGRRQWLAQQKQRGWPNWEPPSRGYDHLRTEAGNAISLSWTETGGKTIWSLEYEVEGEKRIVSGSGEKEVVDPNIQPGDKVAFFMFASKTPIWMRSEDLIHSPNEVFGAYLKKLRYPPRVRVANAITAVLGLVLILLAVTTHLLLTARIIRFVPYVLAYVRSQTTFLYELFIQFKNVHQPPFSALQPGIIEEAILRFASFSFKSLLAISALSWGFYQLFAVAHPKKFQDRRMRLSRYVRQSIGLIAWGAFWYPIAYLGLANLFYCVPASLLVLFLERRFTPDWELIFLVGYLAAYALAVLYGLLHVVRFIVRGFERSIFGMRYR
jgi:hypothetical protein